MSSREKRTREEKASGGPLPAGFFHVPFAHGHTCAFRKCKELVSESDAAVVVLTHQKSLARASAKLRSCFACEWPSPRSNGGRAVFHNKCWKEVLGLSTLSKTEIKAIQESNESAEFLDAPNSILEQVEKAYALFQQAKDSVVAFTGAGISVAAGIPDYRGSSGIDSRSAFGVDDAGASSASSRSAAASSSSSSKRSKQEVIEIHDDEEEEKEGEDEEDEEETDYLKLRPTFTHRALAAMNATGHLRYVVTQNCDDLHRKAGTPSGAISELHGNVFIEYCEKCKKEYRRDYCVDAYSTDCHQEPWFVKCKKCGWGHYTGRLCEDRKCRGKLSDTIVNFSDHLHDRIIGGLKGATEQSKGVHIMLCLGSSLTIYPAADLLDLAKNLIIVNLQRTDFDEKAKVRVFHSSDVFMKLLAQKLELDIV